MTRKTCWCCSKEESIFDSGLCFPCWSWAETHVQGGASEQAIRLAWREAHPDFKIVQTQIGQAIVRAVAPDEVNIEIVPFTLNGIAYDGVYVGVKRYNREGATIWNASSGIYLRRESGGDGTDKARRAVYDAAYFAAAEAAKDDERWLTVGAATHFDSEIEYHRRKIQDEGEEIERLVEAQKTFLRAKLIEEAQA